MVPKTFESKQFSNPKINQNQQNYQFQATIEQYGHEQVIKI
jgi:hypothetical protein